jgi:hypothetical protein
MLQPWDNSASLKKSEHSSVVKHSGQGHNDREEFGKKSWRSSKTLIEGLDLILNMRWSNLHLEILTVVAGPHQDHPPWLSCRSTVSWWQTIQHKESMSPCSNIWMSGYPRQVILCSIHRDILLPLYLDLLQDDRSVVNSLLNYHQKIPIFTFFSNKK